MQLVDLDDDVLVKIFNILPFNELIDLVDKNSRMRELIATHTAIHKFHIDEKLINLRLNNLFYWEVAKPQNDSILIHDDEFASKFLRNFGQIISKLTFTNQLIHSEWHPENHLHNINKYCSDSLKELSIHLNLNTTDIWKKPFKRLTTD